MEEEDADVPFTLPIHHSFPYSFPVDGSLRSLLPDASSLSDDSEAKPLPSCRGQNCFASLVFCVQADLPGY